MFSSPLLIAVLLVAPTTRATVASVTFETTCKMPTLQVAPAFQPVHDLLAGGIDHVSEGSLLVAAVTLGQRTFRVTPPQIAALTREFKSVYAKLAADPAFAGVPSALPQVLSQDADRPGHYFLYRPATVTADTPAIIFLHGFGGNFQCYTWLLKEHFPDHVIIAPSYGIAWTPQGRDYLREVREDASHRLGIPLSHPWLIALSAGGPAGFDFYNQSPRQFQGLICLASCPDPAQVPDLRRDLKVLMLNGVRDDRFPIARVRQTVRPLVGRMLFLELAELESDHFFLLSEPSQTFSAIKAFMARPEPK